jgi:hypothetical protein
MVNVLATLAALMIVSTPASAQLLWCWSFTGNGVSAAGSIANDKDADGEGYYRIIRITGTANSATITALQPTGTAIPGNAGFPVDNRFRPTAPQLTKPGFGFAASDGAYHNPFHIEQYRDYISRPPHADGKGAEPTIQFKAVAAASEAACAPR